MLKGYKILTSFCVICATLYGGAYGAASVRGGATSRAGSIRTLGAGTTASVKTTTARTQPTTTAANANTESTESVGGMRMSHATGLGGTKLPGKVSGTSTSSTASNQNVAELRQAIEQLRNDYDALGEQYNNLLGDVSNVSDTAQVAHETATNNTNTLTVVRSDLSVAKSDIEDLKATGGFDEERVQEALDTTLAQRNYATRGELAATDAVARGAVQVADLSQTLNALNIADKDYVASRTQGVVNDSLNITLENYYTKKQVNDAIDVAKVGMVDKNYVDNQIDGLAAKTYVDNRVASIQTGVSEGAVQGIINNSIDTRLGNYYTKGDIDNAIVDAIGAAKDGMADRDYVDNQVRDLASTEYVNEKVAEIESGVDAGTLYNILETRGYKTSAEVQGIVNDSINNTVANYYTKGQVDNAIKVAKNGMADRNYVDNQIDGLAPKNWVNTVVDAKVNALPLGLDQNAVQAMVEGYGYKDEAGVQEMINASGHVKTSELPDLIKQWAPGAEIQYADGKLYFVDKDGNDRVVDIRGLDGQDGAQVEIQQNDGWIQWHYEGDTEWNNLVAMSDLKGADGKSVDIGVISMSGIKNALVWKKEGETNSDWRFLYNLDDINGIDGCGVRAEKTSTEIGTTVTLLKDCPGQQGHGDVLVSFDVLNGAKGTVDDQQIIDALESNSDFMQLRQLKNKVNDPSTGLESTYNLVVDLYDRVDHEKTGLGATNTLANDAWDKVKDLDYGVTAKTYVNSRIGELGINGVTHREFESVAAKIGDVGYTNTVKDYIDTAIAGVNTNIKVRQGRDGYTYICKTGNNCTGEPDIYSDEWARISVDVSGYLKKGDADGYYASISTEGVANTAQTTATEAKTRANDAWAKLEDLGNNVTVKSYVDDYVSNMVGNLGIDYITGEKYTVRGKIGNFPGTVQDYIDTKIASVSTNVRVEVGWDGGTYICKKGSSCQTQAGPYNTDEWARVTVDMSDYLTEDDTDKLYAPISTVATANEAKTAANTAQQTASQAQSTATAAQSTANDAWGKLSGLSGTVKDYVDDKVGATGLAIRVETGTDGYTYICTASNSDCRDGPSQSSSYWKKIDFTIPSEYLTETEGNAWYAPKAEYALKSDIGTLGGSFSSVADKIGLNNNSDWTNSNKSVKQYVDDKFSSISTDIQVETGTDGFTYICKTGSGCTGEPSQNPSQWTKVNVDLGTLGTNPSSGQVYNVAQKIGLTDAANVNKTVVGYISEQIGSLGSYYDTSTYTYKPYDVKTYMQANYVPLAKLGDDIKNSEQTVAAYIGGKIGALGNYYDAGTSGYVPYASVKQYVDSNFALKSTIGDLGASYTTVAQKIGLTDSNASKTVKQYVDEAIGSLGGSHTSVAGKLGPAIVNGSQTVADYITAQLSTVSTSVIVRPSSNGNDTYICTGTNCTTHYNDPENDGGNWTKLNVDLTAINTILSGFGSGDDKIPTVKGYVDDKIGTLGKIDSATNATSVAVKLGSEITSAEKTVAQYINDKIGDMGGYNNGVYNVYYNVASKIGDIGSTQTVKGYVDNAISGLSSTYAAKSTEDTANNAWDRVKNLGKDVNGDDYTTVAGRLGFGTDNNTKTVKQYIDDKVADVKPTIMTETYQGTTYICSSGNCTNHAPNTGWEELSVDLSALDDIEAILDGFGGEDEPEKVKQYVDNKFGNLGTYVNDNGQTRSYSVENKLGLPSDYANKTVTKYIVDRLGFTDDDANKTVAQYVAEHAASGGVPVQTVSGTTYICSENCDGVGTPPCADGTYPSTCGWQKLEVNLNGYATEQYVDDAIGTLGGDYTNVGDKININSGTVKSYVDAVDNKIGSLGSREVDGEQKPYTVETKIGGIPAVQTIKEYIDNNMPNIDVRPGTGDENKNKLYICTKPSCDTENIPGGTDSGWIELDIASAINLSLYLTKTDAEDMYLKQNGIKLKREGKDIKIWGGGIAQGNAYKVADVEDLMCASYRMEEIGSDDPAYQADKTSFRLVCETVSEDDND